MADFEDLLTRYENAAQTVVDKKHEAAMLEIERAEWVCAEIARLMKDEGTSRAQAEKDAHADPRHRQYQRDIEKLRFIADGADRLARAHEFRLQHETAGGRKVVVL